MFFTKVTDTENKIHQLNNKLFYALHRRNQYNYN